MSKADEINKELNEAVMKIKEYYKDGELDYETEYKRLQEKNLYIQEENEKKLRANQQMWQQIVDDKDKEINWLKSVINGILHRGG